jgi:hypothetical protein
MRVLSLGLLMNFCNSWGLFFLLIYPPKTPPTHQAANWPLRAWGGVKPKKKLRLGRFGLVLGH